MRSLLSFALTTHATHISDFLSELPGESRGTVVSEVLDNLNVSIGDTCHGALGLQRLAELPDAEINRLLKRTFLAVVMDATTSRATLHSLCEYGEFLQDQLFPDSTRLTGTVLLALANLALRHYHGVELGEFETYTVREALEALANSPNLSDELRRHVTDTRSALLNG